MDMVVKSLSHASVNSVLHNSASSHATCVLILNVCFTSAFFGSEFATELLQGC